MSDTEARVEEIRENQAKTYHGGDCDCCEHYHQEVNDVLTAYDEACRQRDAERERAERVERLAECEVKRRRLAQERLHDEHNRPDCDPCDCVTCCEVRAGKEQP